ncbi:MAG TPA: hypothetical protein VLE99_06405, partial [Candidatus Saccharimonadales bacterium]|nr:hypothetical protein [Candidatus Saccharimonadales bacterium]
YLYHWLMSFPYRFISLFTHSQTAHVIVLRMINVGMFAYGLTLYRRIVRRVGVSPALAHSLFAVFVLIPVVPFLAAHINYDNLFFVAVALAVLLTMRLMAGFERGEVDASNVLALLTVLFLSSLIKYPFLPILVTIGLYVLLRLWQTKLLGRLGFKRFTRSFQALPRAKKIVLVVACLLSIGLFAERYGENIVTYHNPVPACDAVISQDECAQYGPYGRDHLLAAEKPADFHASPIEYTWQWLYGMWYRLFFAINYDYATSPPLLVIAWMAVGLAVLLGMGLAVRFRALFAGRPARQLMLWVMAAYSLVLFVDGFGAYAKTGQPVAINGRYLIPFLPFLFAFGGLAWSQLLRRQVVVKTAAASAVIAVLLLQGGGTMTYIIRSGDSWLWPNALVVRINRDVRSAAWPYIIGKNTWQLR